MPESFWHPLLLLPDGWGGRYWFLLATGVTFLALAAYMVVDGRLMEERGHHMVAFELAGTPGEANRIMGDWQADGCGAARRNVLWDFPLILAYGAFFSALCVACSKSAGAVQMFDPRIGIVLAWGVWVAGLCDVVEDIALLLVLNQPAVPGGSPWPRVAQVTAITKFVLLFAAWFYPLGVGVSVLIQSFSAKPTP